MTCYKLNINHVNGQVQPGIVAVDIISKSKRIFSSKDSFTGLHSGTIPPWPWRHMARWKLIIRCSHFGWDRGSTNQLTCHCVWPVWVVEKLCWLKLPTLWDEENVGPTREAKINRPATSLANGVRLLPWMPTGVKTYDDLYCKMWVKQKRMAVYGLVSPDIVSNHGNFGMNYKTMTTYQHIVVHIIKWFAITTFKVVLGWSPL